MSESRTLLMRALRPAPAAYLPRQSLTRRALEQAPPRKTALDAFLGFRWATYVWWSLSLIVGVPVALSAFYHLFIQTPVYSVEARFAVRAAQDRPLAEAYIGASAFDLLPSPSAERARRFDEDGSEAAAGNGGGGGQGGAKETVKQGNKASQIASLAMGALGSSAADVDPFIVADFIKSEDIVEDLDKDGWLRARFANGNPDWFQAVRPDATMEELWRHWRRAVTASLDISTGLLHLEVDAYTPEDALAIAHAIAAESEALVNRMAERGRHDRMAGAQAQLARAEERYSKAEAALRQFRVQEGLIAPAQQAEAAMQQLLTLLSARISLDVQLRMTSAGVDKNAPQVKRIREQIAAIDEEIKRAKAALADVQGSPDAAVNFISAFEQKETERQLATMLYETALDHVEQVKLETERQVSYLTVYAEPFLPHHPTAESLTSQLTPTFILTLMLWGVLTLFVAAGRDYLR